MISLRQIGGQTGMHGRMVEIDGRAVRSLRHALGLSQAAFACRIGVTQPTISRWEKGQIKDMTEGNKRVLRQLAQNAGLVDIIPAQYDIGRKRLVRLSGLIGAGAEVLGADHDMASNALAYVEVPQIFGEVEAVEVRGESMLPAYEEGDVLCCEPFHGSVDDLIGELCLVRLDDDRRYVKRIEPSRRDGRHDLISHNASPIREVLIVEARPVSHIIRKRAVRYA